MFLARSFRPRPVFSRGGRALRLAVKSGAVPPGEEGVVRIEAQGRSRRGRYSVATPRGS